MRSFFIILLLINICYFGWEFDRQTRIEVSNSVRPFNIPNDVKKLELVEESIAHSATSVLDVDINETFRAGENESSHTKDLPLQGISSMMDQGNVMIQKHLVDKSIKGFPKVETKVNQTLCISFGPFVEQKQADDLSNWLQEREIQTKQRSEGGKQDQYFWIYLSSNESKDKAMATIEDLKGKGVQDYRIINKGNLQNAISLGLFSTQSAVNRRLNELKNIGYQPIIVPYHKRKFIVWIDAVVESKVDTKDILAEFVDGYLSRFNSIPIQCDKLLMG